MSGAIQPDGGRVRKLRQQRGWQIEDMAQKADCSERTVRNIENGSRCLPSVLARFASAFNVPYETLLAGEAPPAEPKRLRLQVVLEGDAEALAQSPALGQLVELLRVMAAAAQPAEEKAMRANSLVIEIEMDEADVLRLVALFPLFQQHAYEAIRAGGRSDKESGELRRLVDAVKELRVLAEPSTADLDESQLASKLAGFKASKRPEGRSPEEIAELRRLAEAVEGVFGQMTAIRPPQDVAELMREMLESIEKRRAEQEPPPATPEEQPAEGTQAEAQAPPSAKQ